MHRRNFIALAGAACLAAALPRFAWAQVKPPRVALIDGGIPVAEMQIGRDLNMSAFLEEMAKRGFVEGKTIVYERYLSISGAPTETSENDARRILATSPDVIAISGNPGLILLLKALDKTTPIVAGAADLFTQGIVANLAHPEANITGWGVNASQDFEGKMLSLLADANRGATRFGYAQAGLNGQFRQEAKSNVDSITASANRLSLTMVPIVYAPGGGDEAWRSVLDAARENRVEMIVFGTDRPLANNLQQASLAQLALAAKMPTIAPIGSYAESGGLLGYGANYPQVARGRASYVAAILSGAKPRDLPVMQPTFFDLVINLKTAKSIGVAIPQSVLLQATQVIE